ncbi:hypothetical protein [Anaeromicropila herbilytica]|uniref:Uncharacterized protein n=1 Tax=Anaeromicropila herbilytica TaxID=2785025 RepID=A0A7R7ENN6_9FIRM|nr:hypothetical protein [Anaeromicropila herbilytica]BCN31921.1 hypothetical protein bsdtb5_32160 [Anaeromicropila herbilytica]
MSKTDNDINKTESTLKKIDNDRTNEFNKSLFNNLLNQWGTTSAIIVIILSIVAGIRKMMMFYYYNISFDFFTYDLKEIFIIVFINFVVVFFMILFPYMVNEYFGWNVLGNMNRWIIFIFTALIIGVVYGQKITNAIKMFYQIKITIIVPFMIIWFGISFIYFHLDTLSKNKKGNGNRNRGKLWNIKISVELVCSILSVLFIIALIFVNIFALDIKAKTKYSKIEYKNKEYVILLVTNDKAFIADYISNKTTSSIYTNWYKIINIEGGEISSLIFEKAPEIKKNPN